MQLFAVMASMPSLKMIESLCACHEHFEAPFETIVDDAYFVTVKS